MYSLFCEAQFWTLKNDVHIRNTDFGAFRYYDKKEIEECSYLEGKIFYCNQRGTTFLLKNKRPLKLKDSLRELEQQLATNKIVFHEWKSDNIIHIIFNTGLIATIGVNLYTKDIYKITFDRFLVGKLLSENICDVLSIKSNLIISYNENQLTIVNYNKSISKLNVPQKLVKLEPKVQLADLSGPAGRRLERHLSCSKSEDMILTWWHSSRNDVYPWSPLVKDEDRANIHVYSLAGTKIELLCYLKTESDLINVNFSKIKPSVMWLIEQKVSKKGEVTIEYSSYEIVKKSLKQIFLTSIPLQTQICCHSISPDEEKLILGCIDGCLVLFDESKGITRLVKTAFIPSLIGWHADGALIFIANERCQFQCFDFALSSLRIQLLSEDVAPSNIFDLALYFKSQPMLLHMKWNTKSDVASYVDRYIPNDGLLLLIFEGGPLGVLKLIGGGGLSNDVQHCGLTPDVLIRQYIMWNQCDRALNLLLCLNWNTNGSTCLTSLYHIANHIFRQPFAPEKENFLEAALGSYYSPIRPLSKSSESEFGNQVHDLTRRFFHHLLRYRLYEKAYCLAIDLGDADLFVDLYHCAKLLKDEEMACACKSKFEEFSYQSDYSSRSRASRSSCSCSDSSSDNEAEEHAILPPLPQISVKKAKASKVPPLPELNRQNKLRDSAFFNCSSSYVQSNPLNVSPIDCNLGLPSGLRPQTASTSFGKCYPLSSPGQGRSSKFLEFNLSNTLISPGNFSNSFEIRTSFTGEETSANNFAPIDPVFHRFGDVKGPAIPAVQQPPPSGKVIENICQAHPQNASLKSSSLLETNYYCKPNIFNDSGPLKLKPLLEPRPTNQIYGSNNPVNPIFNFPVQCNSLEPLINSQVGFRPVNNGERPGFRFNSPLTLNHYLPKNPAPKSESNLPLPKIYDRNNLLLQKPLHFVPNPHFQGSSMKPASQVNVKQKVKFSDTVTQIVVPDISKVSIEEETWNSQRQKSIRFDVRSLKPSNPNIISSSLLNEGSSDHSINFVSQSPRNAEEENNTSIKVIHFGVV